MDIFELKPILERELKSGKVTSKALLDRFNLIDERSRKCLSYLDPNYSPFYYYLGKLIKPKNMMEIGFNLGLLSGCFFTSCKTVETFFGFKEKEDAFYSNRIGKSNIKIKYKGNLYFYEGKCFDQEFLDIFSKKTWDLVIINEEGNYDNLLAYFDLVWDKLSESGIIISEYINKDSINKAFQAFAESKNRKPVTIKTRYGTGLIQK